MNWANAAASRGGGRITTDRRIREQVRRIGRRTSERGEERAAGTDTGDGRGRGTRDRRGIDADGGVPVISRRRAMAAGQAWRIYSQTLEPGAPGLRERVRAVPRMLKAVLRGEYKGLSPRTLGMLALGLVYLLSPVDVVPEILVPVVGFADDRTLPPKLAREVAEAIPGAEYVQIERAGHFGYLEQPAEVNRVLVDFCGRFRD